ncbi:MAG: long-chain fatty acid--CoA ligase [Candidatus Eremiobacteraeota bacterium]|nr:long-chain fatty acid--CoA ligase [Candidatus Eremiobacteraeota bacterium]
MDQSSTALDERIRRYIARTNPTECGFERLALDIFAYQYERNDPYRRLCDRSGRNPATVRRWRDVPAIPSASFADVRLACFPPQDAVLAFSSSGTTSGKDTPSRHELDTRALYDASLLSHFQTRVLPDAASMSILSLVPKHTATPHSSLAYMVTKIAAVFGTGEDGFFMTPSGLDFDGLVGALRRCREPVVLFGTALALVEVVDRCVKMQMTFRLPIGSRIVETGGFKGVTRQLSAAKLYDDFSRIFGVPRVLCLSEYGMCELASQWYDANLADYFAGRTPRVGIKVGPHWARVLVVDPRSAQPLPSGSSGLLQYLDLANRGSVAAVLTADVGREEDGGIVLEGRWAGAAPKGCSISTDLALRGADG